MRLGFILLLMSLCGGSYVAAQGAEPPFEAVVVQESAFVRSGPDETEFYPTTKLNRGDHVKVVREDSGGWYLIEPPTGSHSWVPAERVEQRGGSKGIVLSDTFDRIGSELPQDLLFAVNKLQRGETVEIIGEGEIAVERGTVKMLKIKPPRAEYRYISKRDIAPVHEPERKSSGPLAKAALSKTAKKPAAASVPEKKDEDFNLASKGSALPSSADDGVPTPIVEQQTPAAEQPTSAAALTAIASSEPQELPPGTIDANVRLEQIDAEFKEMAEKTVAEWDLPAVREQYLALKEAITDADFRNKVDRRLAAVGRYQAKYNDFLAVQQIMRETETRDEQLRSQYVATRQTVSTPQQVVTRVSRDPQQTLPQTTQPESGWKTTPQGPQSGFTQPTNPGSQPLLPPLQGRKFDGAGIIQRSALNRPGLPQHVLVAPNGRVLAYLQAGPGTNLDRHIGQTMGLHGERAFNSGLNADLMTVRSLTPVQLKTATP